MNKTLCKIINYRCNKVSAINRENGDHDDEDDDGIKQ